MRRRFMLVAAAAMAALLSGPVSAQDWPTKPIKAVVPFGAGSAVDVLARLVFEDLSASLGQPIVVENRGGAGGVLAASQVAKAEPDGHTILVPSAGYAITPALNNNLPYDPVGDLSGVAVIGGLTTVLVVSPSKGFKTIHDLVAAAKAKPGTMTFASLGIGSAVYITAERFRVSAGFEATPVPFKGGAEALTEVMTGRVDFYFCPAATAAGFIKEGKLVALAVSTPHRSASLPDIPTTTELGFANSEYVGWVGFLAPSRTPRPVIEKMNREINKVLALPALRTKLQAMGVDLMAVTPAAFDTMIRTDIEALGKFVKQLGIQPN